MTLNASLVSPYEIGASSELIVPFGSFETVNDFNKQVWALAIQTYDATVTSMLRVSTDVNSKVVLANNCCYRFEVRVTGFDISGNGGTYTITGGIKRITNAAGTALIGSLNKTANENTAGWDVTVVADTTLGALDVQVTGPAGLKTNWGAEVILHKVPIPQ